MFFMNFSCFFFIFLACFQFRTSLLSSMKVHYEESTLGLPSTMVVHRGVVANGQFMDRPTILRADQDFMVNS